MVIDSKSQNIPAAVAAGKQKNPEFNSWICKHSKFSTEVLSSCWSTSAVLKLVLYFLGCRWNLVTNFRLFVASKKPYLRPSYPLVQGCQCNILTNQVAYFLILLFWNPFGPTHRAYETKISGSRGSLLSPPFTVWIGGGGWVSFQTEGLKRPK